MTLTEDSRTEPCLCGGISMASHGHRFYWSNFTSGIYPLLRIILPSLLRIPTENIFAENVALTQGIIS